MEEEVEEVEEEDVLILAGTFTLEADAAKPAAEKAGTSSSSDSVSSSSSTVELFGLNDISSSLSDCVVVFC